MATGTVKWFNETKGFGFIAPDEGGDDVFIHITALPRDVKSLPDGQKLEYDLEQARNGKMAAANVKIL